MPTKDTSIERSVLLRQWTWPLRLAFWTLLVAAGVWAFGALSQAGWAKHRNPDDPVTYQFEHLEAEGAQMATLSPALFQPATVAKWIGDTLYQSSLGVVKVFARTMMNVPGGSRLLFTNEKIRNSSDVGGEYADALMHESGPTWLLLVYSTYAFAMRTAMYAAMLPVLALGLALGCVDGMVARAIRKAGAGRESASIYHRAKLGASFVLITGYLVFLCLPEIPSPATVLVAIAIATALLVRLQTTFYKKYL